MMLKPPRPGSIGAIVPFPPPPSCSPLSGKSSSNTITLSLPVGSGVGSTSTLTVVLAKRELVLHGVAPPRMLQRGGIEAPLMACTQFTLPAPASAPVEGQTGALVLVGNGLAASPGKTEM